MEKKNKQNERRYQRMFVLLGVVALAISVFVVQHQAEREQDPKAVTINHSPLEQGSTLTPAKEKPDDNLNVLSCESLKRKELAESAAKWVQSGQGSFDQNLLWKNVRYKNNQTGKTQILRLVHEETADLREVLALKWFEEDDTGFPWPKDLPDAIQNKRASDQLLNELIEGNVVFSAELATQWVSDRAEIHIVEENDRLTRISALISDRYVRCEEVEDNWTCQCEPESTDPR